MMTKAPKAHADWDNLHYTEADVLVIGGGIAGAMAAIAAREQGLDVLLADRGFFGRSGCSALASGMFSYYRPDDDWAYWLSNHGGTMVNERLLKEAIAFQYDLVHRLEEWGVEWVREGGPRAPIARMGGPGIPFPHSAMMAGGGPQFMMSVRAHARGIGIRVLNRIFMIDLLTSDGQLPTGGRVVGAFGMDTRTGDCIVAEAPVTVMATGPIHFPYPRPAAPFTGMPVELSGDGVAMAFRAGAELGKMEVGGDGLVQAMFHAAQGFEMLLGLGGRLLNGRGENFLPAYAETHEHGSGARRSSLGNAATRELEAGRGPVLRDNRNLDRADIRLLDLVIPIIMRTFRSAGIDVGADLVPYTRALVGSTAVSGAGIHVQPDGRTSLPGLFAAGNTTDGAYVVMGQNLATCAVLGYWAGRATREAVDRARPAGVRPDQIRRLITRMKELRARTGATSLESAHHRVEQVLRGVGRVMTAGKLDAALEELTRIREEELPAVQAGSVREAVKLLGLRNYCEVLDVAYRVMNHRTESRGNVLRADYPCTDNLNWLCMTRARLAPGGEAEIWDVPRPESPEYKEVARTTAPHPFFEGAVCLKGDSGPDVEPGGVRNAVEINTATCTGCGVCAEICPTDVFAQGPVGAPPEVRYPEDCQACFLCVIDCPFQAVTVRTELDQSASRALASWQSVARPETVPRRDEAFQRGARRPARA
jgi:succinate dehydrogenase / fumarate reductase flavoprotein subunit